MRNKTQTLLNIDTKREREEEEERKENHKTQKLNLSSLIIDSGIINHMKFNSW